MAHQSTAAQRSKVQQQQTSQVQLSTERSQVQQHIEVKYSSKEKSSTTAGGQQLGGGVCQPDFMLLHLCCLSNAPSSSSLATLSPIMHQCHHSLLSPYKCTNFCTHMSYILFIIDILCREGISQRMTLPPSSPPTAGTAPSSSAATSRHRNHEHRPHH